MRLFLVRHGETHENARGIVQGQGVGGRLTVKGRTQAKNLGSHLKSEHFHYVYISDLKRAADTAQEVLKHHPKLRFEQTALLRERKMGTYEGRPRGHFRRAVRRSQKPFHLFRARGAESHADLQKRLAAFINDLKTKHRGENILIVSHGAALSTLILHLLDQPINQQNFRAHLPPNAALAIFELNEQGKFLPKLLNSTKHLDQADKVWDPAKFTA